MIELLEVAVRDILEESLGAAPSEVIAHPAYKPSRVWSADGLVLKVNPVADVRAEAWAIRAAEKAGVPVPQVIAEGEDARLPGGRYFLMSFVGGEELPPDPALLGQTGAFLRKLHCVAVRGFGRIDQPTDSWFDWLVAFVEERHRFHDESDLLGLVERWRPQLTDVPCILVHGDIQQCHVRVRDGTIVGFIDFESALGADPAWELARFCTGVGTKESFEVADQMLPTVRSGYGTIDDSRLPLYRALVSLSEVAFNIEREWTSLINSSLDVLRERVNAAWAAT